MVRRLFLLAIIFFIFTMPARAIQSDKSWNSLGISSMATAEERLYGEIIEITETGLLLQTNNGEDRFKIGTGVRFSCNGQPASWRSLRPVYDNAFFEAYLCFNQKKEITAIDGFYCGQECFIAGWNEQQDGLQLSLTTVEGERRLQCRLAPNARLPRQQKWLETGETVFVLFNVQGGARGIYPIN